MRLDQREVRVAAAILAITAGAMIASPALAAGDLIDNITNSYRNGLAGGIEPILRKFANRIFWGLATIEFTYAMLMVLIAKGSAADFLVELMKRILFVGVMSAILNHSSEWGQGMVNTMRELGDQAAQSAGGSGGMRPTDVFTAGKKIATLIWSTDTGVGMGAVGAKVSLGLCAIIIVVVFALITTLMIMALVKGYFITSVGVVMMGLAGSRWTKDMAIGAFKAPLEIGVELLVLQIIVGIGESQIKGYAAALQASGNDIETVLEILAAGVVYLGVAAAIPTWVASKLSGGGGGGGGANPIATAAGQVAGAAAGVGAGLAGAGLAVNNAAKLAGEQLSASGQPASFGALAKGTMSNLGKAAVQDVESRLAGGSRHGTATARMSESLKGDREDLRKQVARRAEREEDRRERAQAYAGSGEKSAGEGTISGGGKMAGGAAGAAGAGEADPMEAGAKSWREERAEASAKAADMEDDGGSRSRPSGSGGNSASSSDDESLRSAERDAAREEE
jgi:type IV secretion system protein TrbL